ncbi:MAG TPA: NAD-dependent epimerase/dehydratase family protein [Mycobacteriales bacterium]|nr:NAD-dependent epimerase/dehydratase family protein [Mycobacteriales bacterium]
MATVFVTGGSGFVGGALLEALRDRGESVHALARTPSAEAEVVARGAIPVRGDITDLTALADGMQDAELVVHAAGRLPGGRTGPDDLRRVNVDGTRTVLAAASKVGVPRLVYVSTEQVVLGDHPVAGADETTPYPDRAATPYAASKLAAERLVLAASGNGLATVAVRPGIVWGRGDPSALPAFLAGTRSGRLRWVDGGSYLVSTTHVQNLVEGIIAAAERGRGGEAYFVTDGTPIAFREFVSTLLATQGVAAPTAEVPRWLARAVAAAAGPAWRWLPLPGHPPVTRTALRSAGETCTVRDDKARRELGYEGKISRQQGLTELEAVRNPAADPAG